MQRDLIAELQDDVWGLLASDPEFFYVPVYRSRTPLERDEDGNVIVGESTVIEDQIEETLAGLVNKNGKSGIAAVVLLPDVRDDGSANAPAPVGMLEIKVRILEDRLINESTNGTGITAGQLALHTWTLLHRRSLRGRSPLEPRDRVIDEVPLPNDRRVHEVTLNYAVGLDNVPKVAAPTVAQAADLITLSCTTAGAAIYYTLDGTWPGSGNPAALLYDEPIELEVGAHTLRFSSEKAAHQSSLDQVAIITVAP